MLADPIRQPLRRHGVGIYSILQHLIRYAAAPPIHTLCVTTNEDRKNFAQCFVSFEKGSSSQAVPPSSQDRVLQYYRFTALETNQY